MRSCTILAALILLLAGGPAVAADAVVATVPEALVPVHEAPAGDLGQKAPKRKGGKKGREGKGKGKGGEGGKGKEKERGEGKEEKEEGRRKVILSLTVPQFDH